MRRLESLDASPLHPEQPRVTLREAPIRITSQDHERLRKVVDHYVEGRQAAAAELLELELDRARVVPQAELPADVVTMRSKVVFEEVGTEQRSEAVLVYPHEADVARSMISVLAPVGMALLGLSRGACISWPVGSRVRTLRVVTVLYQPEAAGDLHL